MDRDYDLLIIGGGINGTAIARDAAGRGHRVLLCEAGDLAQATSSASSKLAHGGLRYLEQMQFRLVRESLEERETLLRTAPHIVRPLRFVLPHTPGTRPRWMLHAGLALYDRLGRRRVLPRSRPFPLSQAPWTDVLKPGLKDGFAYSDCWVDDARLVVLNAIDARMRGATVLTRTRCTRAARADGGWLVDLAPAGGEPWRVRAGAVVNAAGPWADRVRAETAGLAAGPGLRLVKGSHIVVPALYADEHAFILQNDDGRVIFVIPYGQPHGQRFSLIGTTDIAVDDVAAGQVADPDEIAYLCRAVGQYFREPPSPSDVVWSFAGVRALHDDGQANPSAVTRDYVLDLDADHGTPPLLSVFGGKITTARRLAEHALARLMPHLPVRGGPWTAHTALPGGDIAPDALMRELTKCHPGLDSDLLDALSRRHGSLAVEMLKDVRGASDLGRHFGGGLHAIEVDWLCRYEWAHDADDIAWRRTKCGLDMTTAERDGLARYLEGALVAA